MENGQAIADAQGAKTALFLAVPFAQHGNDFPHEALAAAISAIAKRAKQQRDMIMLVGAGDLKLNRHQRVEVVNLLLREVAARVECQSIAARSKLPLRK